MPEKRQITIKKVEVSDDLKKDSEADVQKLTDAYVKEIDGKLSIKDKEIMTV
jgi:ribosome recycling factor